MATEMPFLGRCKRCDYALFATASNVVEVKGFGEVKGDGRAYRVGNEGWFARCGNGHPFFVLKRIKGTFSEVHECDARCLNAKGSECTCSCGGVNHGRGHAVSVTAASTTSVDLSPPASFRQKDLIRELLEEREIPAKGEQTGDERRADAIAKLNADEFSKRQATATIEWLKTLPKEAVRA